MGNRMSSRKRRNRNIRIFVVILIVVVVGAIISYDVKSDKKMSGFGSFMKDVVVSIQSLVYSPFKGLGNFFDDFSNLWDVIEENKILKSNIDKIDSIKTENIELKKELEKLKEELDIDMVLSDYEYINSTVVSRNSLYWYNTLTIDKGSRNGIKEGMAVVNATGLIGRIENVTKGSSDVKLITTNDTNNKISVVINNGNDDLVGLINGYDYDSGFLEVEGISNTEKVNVGDVVYTSGLGGVFPSGVLIGYVESITTDVYDLAKIINVKPSANFDDINYVTVLKRVDDK